MVRVKVSEIESISPTPWDKEEFKLTIEKTEQSPENQKKAKTLTLANTNPCILSFKQMEYAAKGPVICRAFEIEKELRQVCVKFCSL